jgi:cytochrome P450
LHSPLTTHHSHISGPNHIHISDAAALPTVMGIKPFRRSERGLRLMQKCRPPTNLILGYGAATLRGSTGSLLTIIDPQEHAQRRKIWDRSMNTSAILGYGDMLLRRIGQLIHQLQKREGSEVDLSMWLSFLSYVVLLSVWLLLNVFFFSCRFDIMGDLA